MSSGRAFRPSRDRPGGESEPELQTFLDSWPSPVALLDGEGSVVRVNAAWRNAAAANGGRADAYLGDSYVEVCERAVGNGTAAQVGSRLRALLDGRGAAFSAEYRCDSPASPERWCRLRAFPLADGSGVVTVHEDVTPAHLVETRAACAEALFDGVFHSTSDACLLLRLPGQTVVAANDRWVELSGSTRQSLIGHPLEDLGPASDRAQSEAFFTRLFSLGKVRNFLARFTAEDGEVRTARVSGSLASYDSSTFALIVARDATSEEAVARRVRNAETRFQTLFEADLVGVAFWNSDGTVSFNDAFLRMSGYGHDEISSTAVARALLVPPIGDDELRRRFGKGGESGPTPKERMLRTRGGSLLPVLMTSAPIDSGLSTAVTLFLDLTELKAVEAELVGTRLHLGTLVDSLPDVLLRLNAGGVIALVNAAIARVAGFGDRQLVGERLEALGLAPEDLARWRERMALCVAERRIVGAESGGFGDPERRFAVRFVPEISGQGPIESILVICREITAQLHSERERERLRGQVEQASRLAAVGRLATTMAHEFSDVLMVVQPFAELIGHSDYGGAAAEQLRRAAQQTTEAVTRGKRMAQEILRFSRPGEPHAEPLRVRELLDVLVATAGDSIRSTLSIRTVVHGGDLRIAADRGHVEQIFANLLANARDAAPGGGLVISARACDPGESFAFGVVAACEDYVHFRFDDDGCGIPEANLALIFEPLFTTGERGLGLGLAVVQQLAKLNGGEVFVESQPGSGTTVHLFLPKATASESPVPAPRRRPVPGTRVVMVENDAAIRAGVSALLTMEGYAVESTGSGIEAEALIAELQPQIVIVDLRIADRDGVELVTAIRRSRPATRVVVSSARLDERLDLDGLVVLLKPYAIDDLLAMMT